MESRVYICANRALGWPSTLLMRPRFFGLGQCVRCVSIRAVSAPKQSDVRLKQLRSQVKDWAAMMESNGARRSPE